MWQNNAKHIIISLTLIGLLLFSFTLFEKNKAQKSLKEDLIELSSIKYGLFNVDEWKFILANILQKKIEEFEVTAESKQELKAKIKNFLEVSIDNFEKQYYENNSHSFDGMLRNVGANLFNIFRELKNYVPQLTDAIMDFIDDKENKTFLKSFLVNQLENYVEESFAQIDYTKHDIIIKKYDKENRYETISWLTEEIDKIQDSRETDKLIIVLFAVAFCLFILLTKTITVLEATIYVLICLSFLFVGLSLPMLEIDARISEINIVLLGETIHFSDQLLYYKSKSILEVVWLMLTTRDIDLKIVGILIASFSVLFPLAKLTSILLSIIIKKLQSNKVIQFLIFKTGKWSMADVLIVAIFMAYIGFSGILNEQLGQLDNLTTNVEIVTTNKSKLQIGFISFTSFVIVSLLLSQKLSKTLLQKPENRATKTE